jgi:hypothetical protein
MADNAWQDWGKPILTAMGLSLAAYFQITMVTLTTSYFINRSIYRHWGMRLFVGILAALVSLVAFWVVLFLPKAHYFGMFPIMNKAEGDMFWGVTNYFRSEYDPTNTAHLGIAQELVRSSLGWRREDRGANGVWQVNGQVSYREGEALPAEGLVNERLLAEARDVGAISDQATWASRFRAIESTVAAAATAIAPAAAR